MRPSAHAAGRFAAAARYSWKRPGSIVVCAIVCSLTSAYGQTGRAELTGVVYDQSEAVIGGAQVTTSRALTRETYTTVTTVAGVYTFPNLKPGTYSVVFEASGFRKFLREGLSLATGQSVRLDARLAVGSSHDTVTVHGESPLLQTESGSLGQVIENRPILALPLNGRTFVSLVGLASGVALPPGSSFPRINGGRPRVNEYLYDGISVLQPEPGTVAFFPIIDAIQEFRVETNSPAAEFGRFNGGVVNLTTKSGTNDFHGTAFEFLRNEALNADNLFAPTNSPKPLFRRNQFGGVLGGPIVRNRTFFFADYQGTRQEIGRVRVSTVPTVLQRQGVFSEAVGKSVPKIYDPATTQPVAGGGFTRQQFLDNTIPADRIDPVAELLLQRYPLPTASGTANNYTRVGNEGDTQDQADARADHRISDRHQIFARYSYARDYAIPVTPLPDGSGNLTSGATGNATTTGRSVAASYFHVFSPTVTNTVRFGYTRRAINRVALLLDAPPSQALQLPGVPFNADFSNELPTFSIAGFQQLGPSANTDSKFRTDVTQFVDELSWQSGRHSLSAGIDFRWERLDIVQPPSPTGLFQFSSLFTDLPGTSGTGFSLASFLLGQVQAFSIDLQEKPIRPRAHIQEYYLQDDWKATRRLTLNAGVRWTLNFPSTEVNNHGAVFNLQTQQLDYLGKNGFPRSSRELHWHDFGPRLGLAYRFTDKTVLRSGYGLIWIEQAGITTPFTNPQFPFIQTVSQRTLDSINPAFDLASGPSVAPIPLTPEAGLGQGVFTVDRSLGSGYGQQWNFTIQRELSNNLALQIGYTGSKITHVGIPDTNINQLAGQQLAIGLPLLQKIPNPYFGEIPRSSSLGDPTIARAQLLKPFPRFTTVSFFRNNVGNTNYHALQARLEKRFSSGISFLASYTWSKLIDEASSVFDATIFTGPVANFPVADSFNRKLERDVSSGDIPQDLVFSATYDLPFGPSHRLNPRWFAGRLASGWEVTGILSLQSGLPLAVTQATNFNSFAGFGTQRPNRLADPVVSASRASTAEWFNTGAFAVAPQFTLGTSSRNPVRGPGYRNLDFALLKRTSVTERVDLQFRAEVFNLTNTPLLGAPNVVLGTPGFGSITSAGDPRVIQIGLKLEF
ncbi:MAG: TonB-dependent receptor domain-containing protein [Terriglobia bacterium]